jgi:tetratricopeptide (TPR) repeat protein
MFRTLALIVIFATSVTQVYGFGEPPTFDEEETTPVIKAMKKTSLSKRRKENIETTPESEGVISDASELIRQRKKVTQFLKLKQFKQAENALEKIASTDIKDSEKSILDKLQFFKELEALENENAKLFKRKSTGGSGAEKATIRLYKGAQAAYIENKNDLVKDLLIQTLNYDRRHYKAKKFLELGLNLPIGTYKVENVEAKYWKLSLVNLYSGYPEKAVSNLQVLEYFDPKNPLVFERMGSSYYSMGEPRKAVQAWQRALYLDPKNKELGTFIKNAQQEVKRQDKLVKAILAKKKAQEEVSEVQEEMQLLRVVNDANLAYSYAQEVRAEMKGMKVVVEEMDNGKWAVKIPKKKGKKGNKK